jgi:hypothetical protein
MNYTLEDKQKSIERFPKIVFATGYTLEDNYIIIPESAYENIYNITIGNSFPRYLMIDKVGEKQEYLTSDLNEQILIGLLANEMEGTAFLPTFKENQLVDKLYKIKGILPDLRKQLQTSSGEKQLATLHTVPYVTNRLSDILGQKLETKKLRVGTAIAISQSVQLTL